MLFERALFLLPHSLSICFIALFMYSSLCAVCVKTRQLRNLSDSMLMGAVHSDLLNTMSEPNMSRSFICAVDMQLAWSKLLPSDNMSFFLSVIILLGKRRCRTVIVVLRNIFSAGAVVEAEIVTNPP